MARKDEDDVDTHHVREASRERTFKVVVIVVVVLLLTNFLTIVYFVHPAFNPDDGGKVTDPDADPDPDIPPNAWDEPAATQNVTEDTTWTATTGTLDAHDTTFEGAYLSVYLPGQYHDQPKSLNVTGCTFSGEGAHLYIGSDFIDVSAYDDDPGWVPAIQGTVEGNSFESRENHVILHHGLYGQLWGDNNVLGEGAKLYAMYITRLQVIPPESSPFRGAYVFFDDPRVVTEWPYEMFRWISLDGEVLYDVTGDPAKEADPPLLQVLLRSTHRGSLHVRGWGVVDPVADNDEATYDEYPDIHGKVSDLVGDWP